MEAGGFPNIEFSPSGSVEGCVYQLTPKDVQILDKCIGYPEVLFSVFFQCKFK